MSRQTSIITTIEQNPLGEGWRDTNQTIKSDYDSFDRETWVDDNREEFPYCDSYEGLRYELKVFVVNAARSGSRKAVMTMAFGGYKASLNPLQIAEFEWYYEIGSHIGEFQVSSILFDRAINGDSKAMAVYLDQKTQKSLDEDELEMEDPFTIILNKSPEDKDNNIIEFNKAQV